MATSAEIFGQIGQMIPQPGEQSPLVKSIMERGGGAQKIAEGRATANQFGKGFGRSTFADQLSRQAGVQARTPFEDLAAQTQATQQQQNISNLFGLGQVALSEEERERKRQEAEAQKGSNFLNMLLYGGANTVTGGGLGNLFNILFPPQEAVMPQTVQNQISNDAGLAQRRI